MKFTAIILAIMVSLSVPAAVVAVQSGETTVLTDGENYFDAAVTQEPAQLSSAAAGGQMGAVIEPDDQFVVPIETYPDEPFVTGFFEPQIDGILYGDAGETVPGDAVREWADAYGEDVVLWAPNEAQLTGTLYTKQIGDSVYVGLDIDDVDPSDVVETWVQYDSDADGTLSAGDVRIVAPGAAGDRAQPVLETFGEDGWSALSIQTSDLPDDAGLYAAAVESDGTFEAELDLGTLDEVLAVPDSLDDQPYYEFVGHGLVVRTTENTYTLDGAAAYLNDAVVGVSAYNTYLHVPAFELVLPTDDVGIDHVEITQSVQRADNTLPVIRDKETLARVFVTHDNAGDTDVEVRLTGWALDGGVTKLGTLSTTHTAPAGVPDREQESHSANFELPDAWSDAQGLVVRAEVRRPGFVDENDADNDAYEFVPLVETFDPAIYYIRLNTGTERNPVLEPTDDVAAATATLADVYPVADPQFVELDTDVVGSVQGLTPEERLNELNSVAVGILLAIGLSGGDPDIPVPAQVFGFTPGYAGISDPAWASSAASGSSIASIGSVDDSAHDRLIMAHEINHNLGDNDWGRHAGNGTGNALENGCGAGGDAEWQALYDQTYIHEVGWDPAVGIIPTEYPDYQSYCQIWEVSVPGWTGGNDPAQWVSEYRWLRMTDRFANWDGNPIHPDLRSSSASATAASADGEGDVTAEAVAPPSETPVATARIVSGYLDEAGSGELLPSFERPGTVPAALRPPETAENPQALLVVEYANGTSRTIPLTADFDHRHEEAAESVRWPFTVAIADNGAVVGLSLVDPETGEELDSFVAGDWGLTDATFDLPADLERGQANTLGVSVTADTDRQLYKRLLYSPDGSLFYPYGQTFTGESAPVLFEELPGGDTARFLLLVSDGVRTEFAESPTFALSRAPPEVSITRTERWRTISTPAEEPILETAGAEQAGEPTDRQTTTIRVVEPVDIAVGQAVSLDATGQDEYGRPLPASAYSWAIISGIEQPTVTSGGTGPRFDHVFRVPGTYSVVVSVTDPETGLTETDSIVVEVTTPPLPDRETYETFVASILEETSAAPSVTVSASAIDEGQATTVQIDIEDSDDDAHLVWVDWSNGDRTERVVTDGSLTLSRVYGDNGTFDVDVTVLDDGFGVGVAEASVQVSNVAPTVSLSAPDVGTEIVSLPSGDGIIMASGSTVSVTAASVDNGSDDLTFEWSLSGQPLTTTTVFNDGVGPDPRESPDGTFPFAASNSTAFGVDASGAETLSVTVTDDDGDSATASVALLVTGDGDRARSQGYWRHQMAGNGNVDYEVDELEALLDVVTASSLVFTEHVPAATVDEAATMLRVGGPDFRPKAEAQLLAAWLNLAAGGVAWDEQIDVDGDGIPDWTVDDILTVADAIVADQTATVDELERAKDLAEAVSTHDQSDEDDQSLRE